MFRKLTLAVATLAISAGLAGQANAATSTVRLHTDANTTRYLSDTASGVTSMEPNRARPAALDQDRHQLGLRDLQEPVHGPLPHRPLDHRLPGRHPQFAGATNQQWRLNVTKDFQLRLNGAAMKHNTAGNGTGVLMALFNGRNDMKWHTHAA